MEDAGAQAGAQLVVPLIDLAIVTVLALLGAYIAWQQLQTNRERLETNRQRAESEQRDRQLQRLPRPVRPTVARLRRGSDLSPRDDGRPRPGDHAARTV